MRLRVLVSGLAFFAVAIVFAVVPLVAQGHRVNVWAECTITGTAGADALNGTGGRDVICGRGGNDILAGRGGDDILRGGTGSDRMQGDSGRDVLMGQAGNDWLWARDGTHDHVNGGRGFDRYRIDGTLDVRRSLEAKM